MRELTNTKSSDYNVIVQSPSAEWHYSWLKGDCDKRFQWQDGLWFEGKWDGLWFEGIMRWTMVWRKMNETMSKAEVMFIDDVMMELEINNRTERWSKS